MLDQKLRYENRVRYGYVIYQDNISEIKLFYEFGGGNCIVMIYVPKPDEWEIKTNRPLADRELILNFIAKQSIKDQAPNSTYRLSEMAIEILQKT